MRSDYDHQIEVWALDRGERQAKRRGTIWMPRLPAKDEYFEIDGKTYVVSGHAWTVQTGLAIMKILIKEVEC